MLVRIKRRWVDVVDDECRSRECFQLGIGIRDNEGRKLPALCAMRHYHGCPTNSVCSTCHRAHVDAIGSKCKHPGCAGVTVARD